jgi:transposase
MYGPMAKRYNQKLTPELSARFCEAISKGYSIGAACAEVGIARKTYYNWYNRGKEAKSGKYRQFYCDVDNAEDKATHRAEKPIIDAIPHDAREAKWWLIKRRQDLYGERSFNETKVEAEITSDLLVKLERPLPELKDE